MFFLAVYDLNEILNKRATSRWNLDIGLKTQSLFARQISFGFRVAAWKTQFFQANLVSLIHWTGPMILQYPEPFDSSAATNHHCHCCVKRWLGLEMLFGVSENPRTLTVPSPHAFIYYTRTALTTAQNIISSTSPDLVIRIY